MNHHELYRLISTDQTFGAIPMNFQKIHVDYLIILSAGQIWKNKSHFQTTNQ